MDKVNDVQLTDGFGVTYTFPEIISYERYDGERVQVDLSTPCDEWISLDCPPLYLGREGDEVLILNQLELQVVAGDEEAEALLSKIRSWVRDSERAVIERAQDQGWDYGSGRVIDNYDRVNDV
jgi:hypothetical protein